MSVLNSLLSRARRGELGARERLRAELEARIGPLVSRALRTGEPVPGYGHIRPADGEEPRAICRRVAGQVVERLSTKVPAAARETVRL